MSLRVSRKLDLHILITMPFWLVTRTNFAATGIYSVCWELEQLTKKVVEYYFADTDSGSSPIQYFSFVAILMCTIKWDYCIFIVHFRPPAVNQQPNHHFIMPVLTLQLPQILCHQLTRMFHTVSLNMAEMLTRYMASLETRPSFSSACKGLVPRLVYGRLLLNFT